MHSHRLPSLTLELICHYGIMKKYLKEKVHREVQKMAISYNGLWKLLIDKNMKKIDLMEKVDISSSTLAKMSKGEAVSIGILERICDRLDCDFGDIISYERTNWKAEE